MPWEPSRRLLALVVLLVPLASCEGRGTVEQQLPTEPAKAGEVLGAVSHGDRLVCRALDTSWGGPEWMAQPRCGGQGAP